jgi:hypothetical protein
VGDANTAISFDREYHVRHWRPPSSLRPGLGVWYTQVAHLVSIRACANFIATLQAKIDPPDVVIVGKFAGRALAHDASMFQHIPTFRDGDSVLAC